MLKAIIKKIFFSFFNLKDIHDMVVKKAESMDSSHVKCTTCQSWSYQRFYDKNYQPYMELKVENADILEFECPSCGTMNYFHLSIAPVPILCDEKGSPLND